MYRIWWIASLLLLCAVPSRAAIAIVNHTYVPSSTGCSNGSAMATCTFSVTIANTGDTEIVLFSTCFAVACNGGGSVTASDGTNTWQKAIPGDFESSTGAWAMQPWIAPNATAGSYTLTFTLTVFNNGTAVGTDFYYSRAEVIELSGVSTTAPIDYFGCNNATASSASPAITSQGKIAASGELSIAWFNANGTPTNSGSYTTLDSNTADGAMIVYTTPTSGSTTTAAISSGSGTYYASINAFQTTASLSQGPIPATLQFGKTVFF